MSTWRTVSVVASSSWEGRCLFVFWNCIAHVIHTRATWHRSMRPWSRACGADRPRDVMTDEPTARGIPSAPFVVRMTWNILIVRPTLLSLLAAPTRM